MLKLAFLDTEEFDLECDIVQIALLLEREA